MTENLEVYALNTFLDEIENNIASALLLPTGSFQQRSAELKEASMAINSAQDWARDFAETDDKTSIFILMTKNRLSKLKTDLDFEKVLIRNHVSHAVPLTCACANGTGKNNDLKESFVKYQTISSRCSDVAVPPLVEEDTVGTY